MSEQKFKQFWLNYNAEGDETYNFQTTSRYGYIHVIEYAALESLQKENKKKTKAEAALEFLEEWAIYINKGTESIELKCFERGLKKILEMKD
jgi:hypothetical protein